MLSWWVCKANITYHALVSIVQELLAVCANSAPLEHMFSAGRAMVTYKHAPLTVESIETLGTIKCWLRGNNTKWYNNVLDEDA